MTNYTIFDGKKYTFYGDYGRKKEVDRSVKMWKEEGAFVRVTKYLDKAKKYRYIIWVRKDK